MTPLGSGDDIYLQALEVSTAILGEARPEFLVVSAGFDSYRGDNDFTIVNVGSKFFYEAGKRLSTVYSRGLVVVLEGGYGDGLRRGLPAFIAGLTGRDDPVGDPETGSPASSWNFYSRALERLKRALKSHGSPYWALIPDKGSLTR